VKFPKRLWFGSSSIGQALLVLATVFILTLFGMLLYTVTTIQNQKLDSVTVDLAGRQRMLNQRLMNEILLTKQGMPTDYLFTRKILNQTLDALMFGGQTVINLEKEETVTLPPAPTRKILEVLGEQKDIMAEFTQRADAFLKTESDHPGSSDLESLLALNARLNAAANNAVKLFE